MKLPMLKVLLNSQGTRHSESGTALKMVFLFNKSFYSIL